MGDVTQAPYGGSNCVRTTAVAVPRTIEKATYAWEWIVFRAGVIAAGIVFLMMLLIVIEVFCRKLFNFSILVTYDVVGFGLAGLVYLGLAETHRTGSHLRGMVAYNRFPVSMRKPLNIIFSLITMAYLLFLLRYAVPMFIHANVANDMTVGAIQLPIWPAQFLMVIGLITFFVLEFFYFLRLCWGVADKEETISRGTRGPVHEGE